MPDRREDRPARALDHVPDGRGDGLARVVSENPRRHRDAASVAGGTMLRDGSITGRAGHRQERCVLMSAEIAGFASKWRTQRRSRGEQRDHGTAGIACRPEPRLSFTQDGWMGRVSGKCRLRQPQACRYIARGGVRSPRRFVLMLLRSCPPTGREREFCDGAPSDDKVWRCNVRLSSDGSAASARRGPLVGPVGLLHV
jgi:hypothetical protein